MKLTNDEKRELLPLTPVVTKTLQKALNDYDLENIKEIANSYDISDFNYYDPDGNLLIDLLKNLNHRIFSLIENKISNNTEHKNLIEKMRTGTIKKIYKDFLSYYSLPPLSRIDYIEKNLKNFTIDTDSKEIPILIEFFQLCSKQYIEERNLIKLLIEIFLNQGVSINQVTLYGDSPIRSLIESRDPDLLIFGVKKGANLCAGYDSGWGSFWKSYLEIILSDNNFGVETINLLLKLDLLKIQDMRNEDYSSFKKVIIEKLENTSGSLKKQELKGLYEEVLSRRYLQKSHLSLFWQGLKSINKFYKEVLKLETEPTSDTINKGTIGVLLEDGQLTVYWLSMGKIVNKSFSETVVSEISIQLSNLKPNQRSNDPYLIKKIVEKYECSLNLPGAIKEKYFEMNGDLSEFNRICACSV